MACMDTPVCSFCCDRHHVASAGSRCRRTDAANGVSVTSSISGVAVERVAVAVIPFVMILMLDILGLIVFPQIATALPHLIATL